MRVPIVRTLPLLFVAGVAVSGCRDVSTAPATPDASVETVAPLLTAAPGNGIRDRYIVVFRNGTQDVPGLAKRLVATHGGSLHHTYQHALRGFAATLPPAAVDALRRNPNVAYVEQDGIATASAIQYNAPWGLDRIDQPDLPLNGTYNYYFGGLKVYILDTGIRFDHVEFGGRAVAGFDGYGGDASDCYGHGTHVAGIVGGITYGVAKGASLVSVRVLGCSGSGAWSTIIAGVDWVTANHNNSYNPFNPFIRLPAVANMSLAGGANASADQAVGNSIASGVTYVVAAANGGVDACSVSPARVSAAITVGATDASDSRAFFSNSGSSNYGTCVDLFAPGLNIPSAWHTSSTASLAESGTSMAAPHVAGAAALYLDRYQSATPATVESSIVSAAFTNKLSNIGAGSPNRLLNALAYVSSSPLSVTLYCQNGSFGRYCDAYPSGGTGSYSYEWVGATDAYDQRDRSTATPSCPAGYSGSIQVSVTVRDGIGAAYAQTSFTCAG